MDFFAFNKTYVQQLRNGNPATARHFSVYFQKLLQIKLRARGIGSDKVEDLKQDTFIRVIAAVRKEGGVRQPERFGAFVNSTCNNVLLEYYRSLRRNQQMDETHQEIPDRVTDLIVSKQVLGRGGRSRCGCRRGTVRCCGRSFLEEKNKDTACHRGGSQLPAGVAAPGQR